MVFLKQKSNKIIFAILAIALFFALSGGVNLIFAQDSAGSNVEELNSEKAAKSRQLAEIKARVADLQKQINTQRTQIASLANEIKLYDLQIEQTESQIEALEAEIDFINMDIADTVKLISEAEQNIKVKKQLLAQLIREIDNYDRISPLEVILTHDNFSEILNEVQNTVTFENRNQELLGDLVFLKSDLDAKQKALSDKKADLQVVKTQNEATRATLASQQAQKQGLLTYTRGVQTKYQQLLNTASEEESKLSREIYDLDAQIRKQLGDKSLPPVSGILAWPMDGTLTQGYGNTGFTRLGYTFHNGIDVAAPANTPIYAAADGVVYATGTGKASYGNWVTIRHTIIPPEGGTKNIITLYAHLNAIKVSAGQTVLQGDLVGLEGNTGNTTRLLYGPERGYHIHFGVYDEEGFGIQDGAYTSIYGPYKVPYGYTYNPMNFLK